MVMSGSGATTFTKWTIITKALKKTRKDRGPAKPKWYAAAHGNSVPIAVAPVIVTMKPPAMLMSALDTISMAFAALERHGLPALENTAKPVLSGAEGMAVPHKEQAL